MVRIVKLFKGWRVIFLCLPLFMMRSLLSHLWLVSNNLTCLNMAHKQVGVPDININNNNNNIGSLIAAHNANSTDETPPTCEFPQVNIYEPSVIKIAGMNKTTIRCEGNYLPELTYITEDNKLKVNTSKAQEHTEARDLQHCRFRHIFAYEGDDYNLKYSGWSRPFADTIELPKDAEFVEVLCTNKMSAVVSKSFYCLIPKKEHFNEMDFLNLKKRHVMTAPKETLNIIMIGLDTLFRNQFLRGCNKTYTYLMNTLNSFDLTRHSQVGDNTFPNALALFTGTSLEEVNRWWSHEYHMDNFDLIWRTFANAGYRTLFTEDYPRGVLLYLRRGFIHPFARYNSRPLTLAMSLATDMYKKELRCAGNQLEMTLYLEYMKRFLDTFPDKPSFSVAMLIKPTHNDPSDAKMFDDHLLHFYQSLNQKGHLNRSLVVSFSDHGVRYGALRNSVNGHVESRTPFTILTFPDWFLQKYPEVAANLKVNTQRLTSHFDTHATLLDLLYFKSHMPPPLAPLRHGRSLFEKIPWHRTCKEASIPAEFCLCGYKDLGQVNVASELSKQLTGLVIKALNAKTDKNICAIFKLHQIISIHEIALNAGNSTGEHDTFLYQVKLEVNPGKALFAANVYTQKNTTEWQVGYNIDRLNSYIGQADCLKSPMYMIYCYCKNLLPQ